MTKENDLIKACIKGDLNYLIKNIKSDKDVFLPHGDLFYWAVTRGHLKILNYLFNNFDYPYNIYEKSDLVCAAAIWNQLHIVRYLIEEKNFKTYGLLSSAIVSGDFDLFYYCYRKSLPTKEQISAGFTTACEKALLIIADFLLQEGADIAYNNNMPLKLALENQRLDVVKFLLDNGLDITANSKMLFKVFSTFDEQFLVKFLKFLKDYGVNND